MGTSDQDLPLSEAEAALRVSEHVRAGQAYQHAQHMYAAHDEFLEAIRIDPLCSDAYYGLGRCCHHFAREANREAGGDIYFSAGLDHLDKAIEAFEVVTLLDPQMPDGYLNLGLAYDNRSRLEDAEAAYRTAIRLNPEGMDGVDARSNLSLLLFMRAIGWAGLKQFPLISGPIEVTPDVQAAFDLLEESVDLGELIAAIEPSYVPNLIVSRRRLAHWRDWAKQRNKAVDQFAALLALAPEDAEAEAEIQLDRGMSLRRLHGLLSDSRDDDTLREAIECFSKALLYFTEKDSPSKWASTQAEMGFAYADLPTGNVGENIRTAIEYFKASLRLLTEQRQPKEWATILNNLGIAYKNLPTGDRGENLEQAIAYYHQALRIITEQDFPFEWAMTQGNLGLAYYELNTGNREENLSKAINHFWSSLRIYTESEYPNEWAYGQSNLSMAYSNFPTGDRGENVRKGIACGLAALRILTPHNEPVAWGALQTNLGSAYLSLPTGDRADNLLNAIACHQAALSVYTQQHFPADWANTQFNLGLCYAHLPVPNKFDAWEKAVEHLEATLQVYTEQAFPIKWARSQKALANIYLQMPTDNESGNLKRTAAYCRAALRVYTEQDFPEMWAQTMLTLGMAHQRIEGDDPRTQLREAVNFLRASLRVLTERDFPFDWAAVMNNLALLYEDLPSGDAKADIGEAISCYRSALRVWTAEAMPQSRLIVLDNLSRLYYQQQMWEQGLAVCKEAISILENARKVAMTAAERTRLLSAHNNIFDRAVTCNVRLRKFTDALVYAEHGKTRNLVEMLTRRDIKPRHVAGARWQVYLKRLTTAQELERRLGANNSLDARLVEDYPQMREELTRIRTEVEQMEAEFRDADSEYLPTALPLSFPEIQTMVRHANAVLVEFRVTEAGVFVFLLGEDNAGISDEQVIRVPDFTNHELLQILFTNEYGGWLKKYYQLRRGEITFTEWMRCFDTVLTALHDHLMRLVRERLRKLYPDAKRLILVPNKGLNLLPLHATYETAGSVRNYLLDEYEVFYTPSCAVLNHCLRRESERERGEILFAIQNTSSDLPFANWEVEQAAKHFNIGRILSGAEAKAERVKAAISEGHEVLLSCHGIYKPNDVFDSYLALHGGDKLTLGEILKLDLSHSWIVILSACETSMSDYRDVVDEAQGLHTAFIIASASTVVGTLWAVSDLSTALLMKQFHENLYMQGMGKAESLRHAQRWVRDLSTTQIQTLLHDQQNGLGLKETEQSKVLTDGDYGSPFAHPYWWAALQCVGIG